MSTIKFEYTAYEVTLRVAMGQATTVSFDGGGNWEEAKLITSEDSVFLVPGDSRLLLTVLW